jgi:ribosomal protein S18 acetylase RimI-like enzyme
VERTNTLSIEDFITQYISPPAPSAKSEDIPTNPELNTAKSEPKSSIHEIPLDTYSAATISDTDLEACLDLIELTSGSAYAASGGGWSRPAKRKEMKLPDMKYLILRGPSDAADGPGSQSVVLGFLSFMVTYEDGKEVVYCYEIHLSENARGKGLGKLLMGKMEEIGRRIGLEKTMLTVFKSNEMAREFYHRNGYVLDEYSPKPRRLRNGTVKEFGYEILSKQLI